MVFALTESQATPEFLLEHVFDSEYYLSLGAEDSLFTEKPREKHKEYISRIVRGVFEHAAELDGYIDRYAVGWKFERISRTAVAIMKTAMFEVLYMQDVPDKAAISEAVELAKKYEPEETVSFINGILGSFLRSEIKH